MGGGGGTGLFVFPGELPAFIESRTHAYQASTIVLTYIPPPPGLQGASRKPGMAEPMPQQLEVSSVSQHCLNMGGIVVSTTVPDSICYYNKHWPLKQFRGGNGIFGLYFEVTDHH